MTSSVGRQGSQGGDIEFVRLTTIPVRTVAALLNNRRTHRNLPLAGEFSEPAALEWVRAKDAQWEQNGYGPWAILVDGVFAGWGGFQAEEAGPDYALVLDPAYWGRGAAITEKALRVAFGEFGLDAATIALPHTRNSGRLLGRFGFEPDGGVTHGGVHFQRYRLTRDGWPG